MRPTARVSLVFALVFAILLASPGVVRAEKSLFVNLTSDEIHRAAMAISIAQKALASENIPVTIFLNVEGVRIVDMARPLPRHLTGKTHREMLQSFMDEGGKVFACKMCMDGVGGFQKEELMKGVMIANESNLFPLMFEEGATVLSY